MFRTVKAETGEEGHDIIPQPLEHTLSIADDVDVVELREESRTGCVNTADHCAASVSQGLQQRDAL